MSLFLTACNPFEQEEDLPEIPDPPIAVEVTALNQRPTFFLSEVGVVEASKQVEIVAEASGNLESLLVSLGDVVRENQLIGSIDVFTDTTASINLDSAKIQLANAEQSYDETLANSQELIDKAQIQIESTQTSIEQLERNLEELKLNNQNSLQTYEIQVENAQKNVDNVQVSRDNVEAQFDQTWENFFDNAEITFETIFVNTNSHYQTINQIVNPNGRKIIDQNSYNPFLGIKDSNSATTMITFFNQFPGVFNQSKSAYESSLPLDFDTIDSALDNLSELTDVSRQLTQATRQFLDNSVTGQDLSQTTLDAYKASVSASETAVLADIASINQVKQNIQSTQLQQSTQLSTAENNLIIANNQLNDAQNALNQFKNTSQGSVQDLETQIDQAENNLAINVADKDSAQRSAQLQKNAEQLKIDSLKNDVRRAENSFSNNQITATIGGTISELNVDQGDYVSVGTVIGNIIFQDEVKIVFYVTEPQADQLTLGQKVSLYLPSNQEEAFEGTLTTIAPSADPSNRKIKVEVVAKGPFRPEMLVRVEVDVTDRTFDSNATYIELNSIIFGQNDQYVFTAEQDRAMKRTVILGEVIGKWAEVSGLPPEISLIEKGHRRLADGDLIEIISSDNPADQGIVSIDEEDITDNEDTSDSEKNKKESSEIFKQISETNQLLITND